MDPKSVLQQFWFDCEKGRPRPLTGTTVDVVRDGRIIEHWAEAGFSHFLQQLAA